MGNKKHRYAGPRPRTMTNAEIVDRICRNGITLKDLQAYYDRGIREGREEGMAYGYENAYAPLLLAIHELYGFGRDRLMKIAARAAEIQVEHATTDETYEALMDRAGLNLPRIRDGLHLEVEG